MRSWPNLAVIAVLTTVLLGPSQAWAEASVRVESKDATLYVQAEIDTTADSKTAWAVLTDYVRCNLNNAPAFPRCPTFLW
jgi:hypothetical protein